ncbi:uroporphyrinogen decarboxylase [Nitrospirillum viridazoti CBAmc]|uniref:Uroporphyrinogen decarboxylase n=1 Tax=Nitrospirillum viridazoti CBAmc TaxID=1441467 RepID=A0A248JLJ7_9PROT|nr:uroporphyrinogen decarboxylase [Nitrospirillum amazonense]ASG19416.1 uroporphyrinogen decarboxylase [Nitrospirillum amazonense CBAmc]
MEIALSQIQPQSRPDRLLLRTLKGETAPRPPFWLMRQAGRYLPEYREVRAQAGGFLDLCLKPDLATEVTLQPIRRYGMDAAILFSDILILPHALGQKVWFAEGEGPRLDPIRDQAGLDRLDVAHLEERAEPVYEAVRRIRAALPDPVTLIGFAGSPWTVATYMVEGAGSKEFLHAKGWAYKDPAGFQRLIDLLVETTVTHLSAQIRAGAEVVQLFDSWAGALAPAEFARWSIAPTRAIVRALRDKHPGVPVIGFPRGAGVGIQAYVEQTGVDAVSLDTSVPLDWAVSALQSRVPVQGNLDPMALVAGGPALRRAATDILSTLGKGPFIFNLGHGIVQQTPPEHVAELAHLIQEWPSSNQG